MTDILQQEDSQGWLTLRLNDPDRRNALSGDMACALAEALRQAAGDRNVRGITIRGEGGVFCA
ncbi:MAG: enoyl-CoA hydratase-related protein, partial [Parvularcula sp.]|nr:enoyl-CoA hydratase-related protein [Parvularcula sp.]